MPRYTDDELETLKRTVDLAALIRSRGVELRASGQGNLLGVCPFHDDKEPSLGVTPAKGLWRCLSTACGAAGNAIQFVQKFDQLSFRHAVELLKTQSPVLYQPGGPDAKKLPAPVAFDADDATLLRQVADYYHERLQQDRQALDYLHRRGLTAEAIAHFQIGYADRTLGLRLPAMRNQGGAAIRQKLQMLGVYRASGHEHLNGCVTFPLFDQENAVTGFYGRKIFDHLRPGTAYHLYLPGPHRGLCNRAALASREIILCEAVIDAATFWSAGFHNVTCLYGTEGFTDELWGALLAAKVQRVYLAYDRDTAGDAAAERDKIRLLAQGIECLRIKFPPGMDANEFARKVTPPSQSLRVLIHGAEWLGAGTGPCLAPAPSSLAAKATLAEATKGENVPAVVETLPMEERGEDLFITLGERQWRVRGLDKNSGGESLKVNLRLWRNGLFYVNVLDLYQAKARAAFIEEAAKETVAEPELLKRDLGKILLALEQHQEQKLSSLAAPVAAAPVMSEAERAEALALLRDPLLLQRISEDFGQCGVVGEETNKLAGYLAAVSRKLKKPLAVIIQSTSAAGKSALMEAVLGFVPGEECVKYSAMTGQALYYLGEADLKHKVLAIVEEEGAEKASYALKLLQSEGELTIASTSKDETGRLKTEEYHVEGPVMIFLTTTAVDVDEELLNRCLVLTVDEGRAQTEAIHRLQREAETLAGLERAVERTALLRRHQHAQRLLRSLAVVNPFAPSLTFLSDKTRTRRDHVKYLTLIRTVALLHQHQREIKKLADGTEYIEATAADVAAANRLAHEVLGRSLDELPPQTRKLLGLLDALVRERCVKQKVSRNLILFSRREVREKLGWGNTQLKIHLSRLEDMEYLALHRAPGQRQGYLYELLYEGQGADGSRFLSGLIEADMTAYDSNWAGQNGSRSGVNLSKSGGGRPPVGGWPGGGRGHKNGTSPSENGHQPLSNGEITPPGVLHACAS